jgi:predicted dehydrogenase
VVRTFHSLGALAAVAEADVALHPALAAEYPGVPLHADYRSLLADEAITAVVVATPAPTHGQIARDALLAGKDVLVEKPITLASAEAETLVALARERGRILMVGHLLLFQPAIQWLKAYLDGGALGRVVSLHQERLNLGRARAVENALWSLGVHDVAVLLYLMGGQEPCRVEATGHCVLQPSVADDVYLHLHFSDGTQAHLHTSWLWPEKCRRLTVVGSAGMLVYDEVAQTVTLHKKRIASDLQQWDEGSEVLFRGSGEPLMLEAAHFLEGVRSRMPSPLIDGMRGAEVVRVLEQAASGGKGGDDAGSLAGPDGATPGAGG